MSITPNTDDIINIELSILKPHPLHKELYDDTLRPEEREGLTDSIRTNGIIQPFVVNSSNIVLSGSRRMQSALDAGLTTVPCIIQDPEDEALFIVECNRYRKKTISELMREAEKLLVIETEHAKARSQFQTPRTDGVQGGKTRERVAKALGIGSGTTLSKLKKVWEISKTNPGVAEKMKQIDAGQCSINSVFKSLTPTKAAEEMGFDLQIYSIWNFAQPDPTLGRPHPGAIPGQVVQNLVYYYTNPEDLVVDPFGGGGITVDVCRKANRHALVMDIAPVRDDIHQYDISNGFPKEAEGAQLIFLDPPYWNMLAAEYKKLSADTAAVMDLDSFRAFLDAVIVDAYRTLRNGGYLAVIMNPQTHKLPEGMPFLDWPFEVRIGMDGAGFTPIARIVERFGTQVWTAPQVILAKESKQMLQVHGDIIVGMKV